MLAVELERVGKPHLYPQPEFEIEAGQNVVVETARGTELGKVLSTSIPFVGDTPHDAFKALSGHPRLSVGPRDLLRKMVWDTSLLDG